MTPKPQLNLDVRKLNVCDALDVDSESVRLIINSLALEAHESALACGIHSSSVESQLQRAGDIFGRYSRNLIEAVNVSTLIASDIAAISLFFSQECYLLMARAAKNWEAGSINIYTNILGDGHE